MIHCKKCLTVFTNSVGSGTVLCNGCQAKGEPDIFDTQPTCGELSCDECNERYAKALARIKALEDALREYTDYCLRCEERHSTCMMCQKTIEHLNGGK